MKKFLIIPIAVLALSGCANPDKSRDDAADTRNVDHTSPTVLQFNNHYPNVEFKCNDRTGVYVTTHDSAKGRNFQIVPNDPACNKG